MCVILQCVYTGGGKAVVCVCVCVCMLRGVGGSVVWCITEMGYGLLFVTQSWLGVVLPVRSLLTWYCCRILRGVALKGDAK